MTEQTKIELIKELLINDNENETELSLYKCMNCNWCLVGNCFQINGEEEIHSPNFCPKCGTKVNEVITKKKQTSIYLDVDVAEKFDEEAKKHGKGFKSELINALLRKELEKEV
ncbi:ribbon-helix-helix domain-containing protein [Chengkuizengella sediminis]|uniref:ribbon-helix-helix domain-containing protein n=1 Tax=Chengkuizengella sediminis TaxID=1885917 RepID=UPI001389CD38|nr:ribbon-helix-helix domain-containing protein [Chengkuizengella sediminis]NDI34683.1 BrnA antitoxin family protein [Chengkuizengella sediminis]